VQLPPSLAFEKGEAQQFLRALREFHQGPAALEARHAGWFTPEADVVLQSGHVGRVLADPVFSTLAAGRAAIRPWCTCGCTDRRACITRPIRATCWMRLLYGLALRQRPAHLHRSGASLTIPPAVQRQAMRFTPCVPWQTQIEPDESPASLCRSHFLKVVAEGLISNGRPALSPARLCGSARMRAGH
jgi:hypothetical protein